MQWLEEYSANHRNVVNQRFHFVCVPAIVFSLICALKAIPAGDAWVNPASLVMAAALAYYFRLSWRLALGLLAAFALMYWGALALETAAGGALIWVAVGIFVVAWVGQFIGHAIERARPSFFKDLQFLLIGPLWEMWHLYRALGLPSGAGQPAGHDINHA
jgi:uncharacterized membrane protein YGL010W